jgi:hypothetical protein
MKASKVFAWVLPSTNQVFFTNERGHFVGGRFNAYAGPKSRLESFCHYLGEL